MPALDSLRGLAILQVTAAHFLPGTLLAGTAGALVYSLGSGGVLLFFLLSGYLIFRNLERQNLPTFFSRRLFKLLPAYWLNGLVIVAMGASLAEYPRYSLSAYAANFLMLPDLFRQTLISGNYWTLVIEIKFYVIVALQRHFLRFRSPLVVPAAVMAGNFAFWLAFGRGSILLSYLPVFYVGIEIFRAEQSGWEVRACARLAAVTAAVALSLLLFVEFVAVASAVHVVVQAALFIAVLRAQWGPAVLRFFGRISYSLYLYESVVGYELLRRFEGAAPPWVVVAGAFAVSVLVAYLSFVLVEETGVAHGRQMERRRRLRAAPAD